MTRKVLYGEAELSASGGRPLRCRYQLLVRTLPPPLELESYGVGISIPQTGEEEEIWDITVSSARILDLADRLMRGGVTPCTLREVVEDRL